MRSLFSVLEQGWPGFKKKAWFRCRCDRGISLLEVSIVLAILGIIGTASLSYLSKQRYQGRLAKTLSHQEIIITSLANYAMTHHKFPCPASQGGRARESCSGHLAMGRVPYETLGLPSHYSQDGWGYEYLYAVNSMMTQTSFDATEEVKKLERFCRLKDSPIELFTSSSHKIAVPQKDPLAFVLISRGEAGHHPIGTGEKMNETPDMKFRLEPYQTQASCPYRHRLTWWTRNNLLSRYGGFSCPGFLTKLLIDQKKEKDEEQDLHEEFEDPL